MRKFYFKAITISVILTALLSQTINQQRVLAAVIIIVITGALTLLDDKKIRIAIVIGYGIASMFFPLLKYGLIIIVYDMDSIYLLAIIGLNAYGLNPMELFELVTLSLIAYYVKGIEKKADTAQHQMETLKLQQESLDINRHIIAKQQEEKQQDDLDFTRLGERNRIARDIHDNVGHLLSSAIIQVGALQAINQEPAITPLYETLKETLDQGMNSIRKSVHDLYQDSTPLENEIKAVIEMMPTLNVKFVYKIETTMDQLKKNTLISIINESLNNTVKHSNGTEVNLTLDESDESYYCIIQDNGTNNKTKNFTGIGLAGIEKRVRNLKGICNIQTENGYRIYINIPKETL